MANDDLTRTEPLAVAMPTLEDRLAACEATLEWVSARCGTLECQLAAMAARTPAL